MVPNLPTTWRGCRLICTIYSYILGNILKRTLNQVQQMWQHDNMTVEGWNLRQPEPSSVRGIENTLGLYIVVILPRGICFYLVAPYGNCQRQYQDYWWSYNSNYMILYWFPLAIFPSFCFLPDHLVLRNVSCFLPLTCVVLYYTCNHEWVCREWILVTIVATRESVPFDLRLRAEHTSRVIFRIYLRSRTGVPAIATISLVNRLTGERVSQRAIYCYGMFTVFVHASARKTFKQVSVGSRDSGVKNNYTNFCRVLQLVFLVQYYTYVSIE